MKFLFYPLLILFATLQANAQVILGRVTDNGQRPVVGATVQQQNARTGTVTDTNGRFELRLNNTKDPIIVSFVGFLAQTLDIQGKTQVDVVLQEDDQLLGGVVVVGSRNANNRTVLNSSVPVDVIEVRELVRQNPLNNLNDILTYLAPAFNANRQSASDGTEHIDPASLRGLGPDQVLVLINGKRRHTTSLVNYQNTVGNGSVGTDLNSIPASAIERIEVLRDGASAQYGSDAIAGVINIVLKKDAGFNAQYSSGITQAGDGETADFSASYGASLANKGFIEISTQLNHRGATNRTQHHDLIIFDQSALDNYFAYDFTNDPAASRTYDDDLLRAKGLTRDDFNFHVGDSQVNNAQAFVNVGYTVSDETDVYAFGGLSHRSGVGYGFRRLPSETGNVVASLFPNGFQPTLNSNIWDASLVLGAKTRLGNGGVLDLSLTNGRNAFAYQVENTNNASMGNASPTSFDAGSHGFSQSTFNADYAHYYPFVLNGFNIASGLEYRIERYQIVAGEPGSYQKSTVNPDGAAGAQSFPGFSPLNAVNALRSNVSAYVDAEADLTPQLLISAAGRFERYTDFGNTTNGKVTGRYKLSPHFSVRAGWSTGFRAPSLQQQYFNNIATDVVDGVLLNSGIFTNDSAIAKTLGIPKLKEETSQNLSVGLSASPAPNFSVTLDAYQIDVDNRIVLTGNIGNDPFGEPIPALRALFATAGAATGRFFTNAINTQTRGLDLVTSYKASLNPQNALTIFLTGNYNHNEVVSLNEIPTALAGQEDVYYGPQERSLIETNTPRLKGSLQLSWDHAKWNILLRNTYFGEVTRNGFPFGTEQTHSAKVVTDLTVSYQLPQNVTLTAGANNLFNVFPDEQVYENSYFGVFKYAPVQMGTTGAYYFARLTYGLGK